MKVSKPLEAKSFTQYQGVNGGGGPETKHPDSWATPSKNYIMKKIEK